MELYFGFLINLGFYFNVKNKLIILSEFYFKKKL